MKKQLLTGALLLSSIFAVNAQVVWSDDFNDEDIADWTLIDSDGDTFMWGDTFTVNDDDENPITPVSLISRSWNGAALEPDNWAISPLINLSANDGDGITLSWIRQTNEGFPEDKYTVYVATANDIETLMASEVTYTETPNEENAMPTTRTLDLSSFAGEAAVYVAFRHYDSSDFDFISIDDVTVTAGVASVNDVLASKLSVYPNPASNIINITNAENILLNGVEIVDLNGRTIKYVKYNGVGEAQINISDLATGMYLMNVSSDKGITTKKIVKN